MFTNGTQEKLSRFALNLYRSNMVVDVDNNSGFCFGVVKAIEKAEILLTSSEKLFCLGEIVHNGEEVHRLSEKGLVTINLSDIDKLEGKRLLLRAHGVCPYSKVPKL